VNPSTIKFESRELQPFSQPVSPDQLNVGDHYFSVTFADAGMTIPLIETLVFIGRDLDPGDGHKLHFQDVESYREGKRLETAQEGDGARFFACSPSDCGAIFDFERALEELMRCAIRRRDR
jgi:hypothetical protein